MSTDGSCPHHPAIRLRRYNRRTAEWKTLLETCPLCASGLPPSNSDGGGISNYEDDEATVSSRYSTSRHCDTDRSRGGGSIADESAATTTSNYSATTMSNYSAATTQTGTSTVNTDVTYNSFGEGKSWSSMSTRKRGNGNNNISSYTSGDRENSGGGGYHYSGDNERNRERYKDEEEERQYTDDEGYKTEDTDENEALDSSMRSGMSSNKGVRFGPGTKEASEAGTDLESEAGDDVSCKNLYLLYSIVFFVVCVVVGGFFYCDADDCVVACCDFSGFVKSMWVQTMKFVCLYFLDY
jgi:hypothetical protein